MSKVSSLKKPTLNTVRVFAEGPRSKTARPVSGQVPVGDVRMTANIRSDLHLKLKVLAAERRTTVGDLIEEWIRSWR